MNCPLIQNGFIKDAGEFESKHFFDKQSTNMAINSIGQILQNIWEIF